MNWTIEYIKKGNFVKVTVEGDFSLGELEKMDEDIFRQKFWRPGMNVLFDHRKLDFGVTDIEMMRGASQLHVKNNEKIGNGKAAFLMKSLPDFARGRQFELLTESKVSAKMRVFKDEDEALEWIAE